jgi:hypothetical protein
VCKPVFKRGLCDLWKMLAPSFAFAGGQAQDFGDCMRDESAARQQLNALWSANPGTVRESCEIEATAPEHLRYQNQRPAISRRLHYERHR